eukprot:m.121464 g.121464  ORF g.121464 m.121464 type:complete len:400 (+) comp28858_c0_seq2:46-1245(+)
MAMTSPAMLLSIALMATNLVNANKYSIESNPSPTKHQLSTPILAAYANWGQCDQKLVTAAQDGVNTLIWFSINLVKDTDTGAPTITGPATGAEFYDCVAKITLEMNDRGINITHLISIGGWNSPHPDTSFTADEWWQIWKDWNENEVARPEQQWGGFNGFDWDIEGNDDGAHHGNVFTQATLDLMGQLSVLAKHDGYLVAMAPAQSYLDSSTQQFSRRVDFPPHDSWQPQFFYHGRNLYAYLLAEYGVDTFDFISIQLYEGYSTANYGISEINIEPSVYLENFVESVASGWTVDFTSDPGTKHLGRYLIKFDRSKLVIGLANGWTSPPPDKFLLIWPEDCGRAYVEMKRKSLEPRGFMFWNVADEGNIVEKTEPPRALWLARELRPYLFAELSNEDQPL